MAKQKVKKPQVHNHKNPLPPIEENVPFSFQNFKIQTLALIVIGFVFYANSFYNEYCLDDGIVIQKNEYVQNGFGGVGKILTTDAYDSFYRQMGAEQELAGGRYRPLSIVTFAIEEGLFGSNEKIKPVDDLAFIRHVLNVILYIFSIIVLLYFLRNFIFKNTPLVAFIACLLFLIHPIHTEVVSNVKSRDEILSFLFVILTFIAVLRYRENKLNKSNLYYGLLFYFLALLSKEYAITLLILIPMLLYVYSKDELKESIVATLPYFLVAAIYLYIRFSIVGAGKTEGNVDVLNSPFKWATDSEKWATKFDIVMRYLKLLFYPDPLSSDYSFKTIPYSNFGDGKVWVSIVIHLSAIIATVVLFFKRNVLAFALAFYIGHLALVANFIMEIGATMGERLVYNSSFGFVILLAVGFNAGLEKIKQKKLKIGIGILVMSIVVIWCGDKVIKRNQDWKRDSVLFIADAKTVPNSVLVNGNAGKAYMDLSELKENKEEELKFINKAIYHLQRAISLHPSYVNGYLNLGVAYYKLEEFDKAKAQWDMAKKLYPNNPFLVTNYKALGTLYYQKAVKIGKTEPLEVAKLLEAIKLLEKAVAVQPNNATFWYDLGGVSYMVNDHKKARMAWERSLQIDPSNERAKKGLAALPPQ